MAATLHRPSPATALTGSTGVATLENPAFQAFWLLRIGFTVAPILFGADKFGHVLVDWDKYLAPRIVDHLPWTAHQVMYGVGVSGTLGENACDLEVTARLVETSEAERDSRGHEADPDDIALRDFGLLIGALTLARLATAFSPRRVQTAPARP